jgi:hemerythrin-like metal-binding protein
MTLWESRMERLDHYKTQIGIIDDDHREIYTMIRNLIADTENRLPVTDKLLKLKDKLEEHCETEETIMIQIQFPYLEYHKADHHKMSEYLHFISISSNLMNVKMLLQTFEVKLIKHFEDFDMQIYPFIRQK